MSLLDRLVGSARAIILIDDKVDRLERAVEKLTDKIDNHEQRLIRVETVIEFARSAARPDPKLPGR